MDVVYLAGEMNLAILSCDSNALLDDSDPFSPRTCAHLLQSPHIKPFAFEHTNSLKITESFPRTALEALGRLP